MTERTCPTCGAPWSEHPGIEATCAKLRAAMECIADMGDRLEESDLAVRAVFYVETLGIYAVPLVRDGEIKWTLRTAKGFDPDIKWLLEVDPSAQGWPSWADAIVALGEHLESVDKNGR